MAQGKPKRAQSTTKRSRPVSPKQAPSPRGLAGPETLFGWTLLDAPIQTEIPRMTAPGGQSPRDIPFSPGAIRADFPGFQCRMAAPFVWGVAWSPALAQLALATVASLSFPRDCAKVQQSWPMAGVCRDAGPVSRTGRGQFLSSSSLPCGARSVGSIPGCLGSGDRGPGCLPAASL